jgi:hypothetical protein
MNKFYIWRNTMSSKVYMNVSDLPIDDYDVALYQGNDFIEYGKKTGLLSVIINPSAHEASNIEKNLFNEGLVPYYRVDGKCVIAGPAILKNLGSISNLTQQEGTYLGVPDYDIAYLWNIFTKLSANIDDSVSLKAYDLLTEDMGTGLSMGQFSGHTLPNLCAGLNHLIDHA